MQRVRGIFPGRRKFGLAVMAISLGMSGLLAGGAARAASAGASQPVHGGTLNWIVTPEPASFIPLTTTAGTNAELGPKVVEGLRSEEHTSELQSLMRISYAVFCLKKKNKTLTHKN